MRLIAAIKTGLFHASAAGLVPSGTRYIQVTVTSFNGGYNDGYAHLSVCSARRTCTCR